MTQHKTTTQQLKALNIKNKGKLQPPSISSTYQTKEEGFKR